ncbi:DUF58 domain-containing protein [Algicella marina]|uniref:DUF58 domain-containing protein n=1 Tax=Algicella marina TaxID=2683284 RepID=A0A6P1SWI6_9RHOB|nr:DUF58 domain-containing protein [Algicella marina]QHQ33885.1 DUF58 domain-containing protein [Algicella marina]
MRPSRRLLAIASAFLAATALTVSALAAPLLPVALLWGALLSFMLADLAISPSRRAIAVEVTAPDEVFTGEDAIIRASIRSQGQPIPTSLSAILELSGDLGTRQDFTLRGSSRAVLGEARVPARRRGTFALPGLWLSWPSRLGLWEFTPHFSLDTVLRVIPNIRPVVSGQIDVRVQSDLYGVKENALVGEGSEFHQMRDFMPGMDTRGIDWKRSARRRDLVVKEMQSERNHQIIVALDNGYLMREELAGLPKIDHAVNAALATAWAAGIGGDLVGLYSFDAVPRLFVPPQPGRAAFPALRAHTADLSYQTASSNPTLALAHLNGKLNRRSLIIIFSDFADTTTAELLVENLTVLNRAHVIIFATFSDPELEWRVGTAAHSLNGMAEAVAATEMVKERRLVLDGLSRIGVICLETNPGELTARLVSTYLEIKAQELI